MPSNFSVNGGDLQAGFARPQAAPVTSDATTYDRLLLTI